MSNRNYASGGKIYSMHVKPVMVTATAQIGASGAVSSFVGSMVQSVTRTSIGLYKIKLQSNTNFPRLYSAMGSMQSAPSALSGIATIEIQNSPNTSAQIPTGAELSVKTLDITGALADPASGSALNVMAIFSDSVILINGE